MGTFIPFPYFALVNLYRALTESEKSLPSWYVTSYYSVLSHLLPTTTSTVLLIIYSYFQVHCLVVLLPICSLQRMISYSRYRIHIKLSMILFFRHKYVGSKLELLIDISIDLLCPIFGISSSFLLCSKFLIRMLHLMLVS